MNGVGVRKALHMGHIDRRGIGSQGPVSCCRRGLTLAGGVGAMGAAGSATLWMEGPGAAAGQLGGLGGLFIKYLNRVGQK